MVADEELLGNVGSARAPATIRCYTWGCACVTYGRLQHESGVRAEYAALDLYRRPTGGRAVLHDADLTLAVCARHDFVERWSRGSERTGGLHAVYSRLVSPVRKTLSMYGVETRMGEAAEFRRGVHSSVAESVDCFASSARCDVVDATSGKKLMGSAMRRTPAAVLLQLSLRPIVGFDVTGDAFVLELRKQYETR